MIHDLDLLLALVRAPVQSVTALGLSLFGAPGRHCDKCTQLVFADGCVASMTASRASMTPRRAMRVWSPEGFLDLDFSKKTLTLVQPSEHLRRHGLDPSKLDPASRAMLKDELFGRHLEVQELDCNGGPDGLTRELQEFVHCIRWGTRPRIGAEEARDAIRLATQIADSLQKHRWQASESGPCGPTHMPFPIGQLFSPAARSAAA